MNRRGFFATMIAPFLARFAPKVHPVDKLSVFEEVEAKMLNARMSMAEYLAADMYRVDPTRSPILLNLKPPELPDYAHNYIRLVQDKVQRLM